MALEVPVACIEKVEAAQLEPGPPIVGSGGEVATQEVDSHLALSTALEGSSARCHVRIDGGLGGQAAGPDHQGDRQRRRAPAQTLERPIRP
jgi:hypothetical protein